MNHSNRIMNHALAANLRELGDDDLSSCLGGSAGMSVGDVPGDPVAQPDCSFSVTGTTFSIDCNWNFSLEAATNFAAAFDAFSDAGCNISGYTAANAQLGLAWGTATVSSCPAGADEGSSTGDCGDGDGGSCGEGEGEGGGGGDGGGGL